MIYLFGDVNVDMAVDVFYRLGKNSTRSNFIINSMGGSLADGLAIYDRINMLPKSIITATGICASAAALILQAGKVRRATPNTQFMFHLSDFGNLEDNKRFKTHYDSLIQDIFLQKMDYKDYSDALKLRTFGVAEAIILNVIDEVWEGKSEKSGLS